APDLYGVRMETQELHENVALELLALIEPPLQLRRWWDGDRRDEQLVLRAHGALLGEVSALRRNLGHVMPSHVRSATPPLPLHPTLGIPNLPVAAQALCGREVRKNLGRHYRRLRSLRGGCQNPTAQLPLSRGLQLGRQATKASDVAASLERG